MNTQTATNTVNKTETINSLFKAGAHFGLGRSRRHPSMLPFIFGEKNKVEIFDLEITEPFLAKAKEYVASLAKTGRPILFVGGKSEARKAIKDGAESIAMPYVNGRWIGGSLTNFPEIRKRIEKFERLNSEKEKGELTKYTKKERLLIDKDIERLNGLFGGIVSMAGLPGALFIIDSKKEAIAVAEARDKNIPVIALCGSDCDISKVNYPVVANDTAIASVKFFADKIAEAYSSGKKAVVKEVVSAR